MRYIIKGSIFGGEQRENEFLYIFLFSSFIFLIYFILFSFQFLKIGIVDWSYNIELGSLYIKIHYCLNLSRI